MSFLLIHSARQLVTLRGGAGPRRGTEMNRLQIIEDGAVLIEDEVIREVGPTRRLENLAPARKARTISAAGRVVIPGFVDSHTHLVSGPSQLGHEPGAAGPGVPRDARSVLPNVMTVRDTTSRRLLATASGVLRQCIAHGTTTIEAKSGYGLNAGGETKIARVLTKLGDMPIDVVPTFFAALVVPPEFEGRPEEYIRWVSEELLPAMHRRGLVRFVDGCCDAGAFTAEQLRPYYQAARTLRLPIKLHASQFAPTDAAQLLESFAFSSVDHFEHLDAEGINRVARAATIATVTPAPSFFLGSRKYAPARQLIAAGVPVALASNYSRVTSPTYNMQLVMFLACRELGMTPAEALVAATINGAYAVKLGNRVGSLEPGKQADLLILNVGDYREVAFEFGINLVGVTIKRGAVLFDGSGVKWPEHS
jgi:imidazolonepropionase